MIRCNHCGIDNLDGSEYCDECGTKLNASAAPNTSGAAPRQTSAPPASQFITQVAPPPPPSFTKDTITPKPATPYTPPPPPVRPAVDRAPDRNVDRVMDQTLNQAAPQASGFPSPPSVSEVAANKSQSGVQTPNQTTAFNGQTTSMRGGAPNADSGKQQVMRDENSGASPPAPAKLIIQRGGKVGKEFPIAGTESMIGRWDADGGIFPDIDLDQDDPEAKVSRRHARIQFLNNQYLIEDLGSTNGTFINRGPRLLPGAKQPLNNGDEIIVGKTFLKFVLS
jgi:hypothetical protein